MNLLKKIKPLLFFILSAIITLIVLLTLSQNLEKSFFKHLPLFNTLINAATFIILIFAFFAIKKKNIPLHKRLMWTAFVFSSIFLISYVVYHSNMPSTPYGGSGIIKTIYFFILTTHIFLSAFLVPLILISLVRALSEKFDKHRRIAKITFPIWIYVSATGILVYLMISPYYQ